MPDLGALTCEEEQQLTLDDLNMAVVLSKAVFDPQSDPEQPLAPESHYARLSQAVVAFVRAYPDTAAVPALTMCLQRLDQAAHDRRRRVEIETVLRHPEVGAAAREELRRGLAERTPEKYRLEVLQAYSLA